MPEQDMAMVYFYSKPCERKFKSEQEGRPIYDPVDYVNIRYAGEDKTVNDHAATDSDKETWSRQWGLYQRGHNMEISGTPLAEWSKLKPTDVMRLQSCGIYSVEDLADIDDKQRKDIGEDAGHLQVRAQYLLKEATSKSANANAMARNDELMAEVRELQALNAKLTMANAELIAAAAAKAAEPEEPEALTHGGAAGGSMASASEGATA